MVSGEHCRRGAGKWKASVIYCGMHITTKGALTTGFDQDMKLKAPYLAFLLQDGETNLLIDAGIGEHFLIDGKAWGGCPADAGSKYLLSSLAEKGLCPDDIDMVIYTHLHNDHVGNCGLFPRTRSLAQRAEWIALNNPVFAEQLRRDYDAAAIPVLRSNPNFMVIDGDYQLTEGVRIIKTPGHTRGSQSIIVNTTAGLRVFVGDQFHIPCCCFPSMTEMYDCDGVVHRITPGPENWPTLPGSLVYDYYDYYESADKIKAVLPELDPGYIVCGHDPDLLFREI